MYGPYSPVSFLVPKFLLQIREVGYYNMETLEIRFFPSSEFVFSACCSCCLYFRDFLKLVKKIKLIYKTSSKKSLKLILYYLPCVPPEVSVPLA